MRRLSLSSILCALIILLNGCAQSYQVIEPQKLNYSASNELENIGVYYQYDVLNKKGNKKFSNKENKKNIKVLAVKVVNNSNSTINIGNNAAFFSNNTMIFPIDPIALKSELKQSTASYLFYLLLAPLTFTINNSSPFPFGLILAPIITGGNMGAAAGANKNFYNELTQYDILYQDIEPGNTAFGLVAFRNIDYIPISIKFIK